MIVKKIGDIREPVANDVGELIIFDNELDANIERIYLQPDHVEPLLIHETNIGEK